MTNHQLREENTGIYPRCSERVRLSLLQSQCPHVVKTLNNLTKSEYKTLVRGIYVDLKHKLVACLPPKSGCTTWKIILVNNSGTEPLPNYIENKQVNNFLWLKARGLVPLKFFNKTMQHRFLADDKFYRFMVARHPFERLYSAFVDKLVPPVDPFIERNTMPELQEIFNPNLTPDQRKKEVNITFHQFLKYLKFCESYNIHWESVYNICQPCVVNYQQLLKTETFDEDINKVIFEHLGPFYRGSGTWYNRMMGGSHETRTQHGRHMEAYKGTPNSDIDYLAKKFHKDLTHFGYAWKMNETGMYSSCITDERCC